MRLWIGLSLVLACLAAPVVANASPPTAAAARACKAPKYPGRGYFTSLTVTGASCRTGSKVALAHYRCRTASGRKGRCHRRVLGYSCSEKRKAIPTEFNARVTCRKGGAKVIYTYQQNT